MRRSSNRPNFGRPPIRLGWEDGGGQTLGHEGSPQDALDITMRTAGHPVLPGLPTTPVRPPCPAIPSCHDRPPCPPGLSSPVRPFTMAFTPSPRATPGPSRPFRLAFSPPRHGIRDRERRGLPDLVYSDNDDSDSDAGPGIEIGRTVRKPGHYREHRGEVSGEQAQSQPGGADQQEESPAVTVQPVAAPLLAAPQVVRNIREEHLRATAEQAANLADRRDTWRENNRVPANGEAAHNDQGPGSVREVAGGNGDQVPLEELINPVVPGPHPEPIPEDAEGWNMIDQWGVWDCTLCEFPTMQNFPGYTERFGHLLLLRSY